MIKVTYQKKNGDIIERYSTISAPYNIGEINGFGWLVINKEYSYKGKYYSSEKYDDLLNKIYKKDTIIRLIKKKLLKAINEIGYIYFVLSVLKYLLNKMM